MRFWLVSKVGLSGWGILSQGEERMVVSPRFQSLGEAWCQGGASCLKMVVSLRYQSPVRPGAGCEGA